MKKCRLCGYEKDLSAFSQGGRDKDGHQGYCKDCSNALGRENYHANKERYFANAKKRDEEMRTWLRELKSSPCTDCKTQYPWYVMEFDHLRDKEMDISKMMRRRMAKSKIEAEIAKCELVCANCHRARSYQRWSK